VIAAPGATDIDAEASGRTSGARARVTANVRVGGPLEAPRVTWIRVVFTK
jgi:hypothetical protein